MLKLWQAIGLQSSAYQKVNFNPHNVPQCVPHQSQEACTNTFNVPNINSSSLKQLKQRTKQFMQYQNHLPQQSNHELSIEIESCDSQPLDSLQSNINIRSSCNKPIATAEIKYKLTRIVQKMSSIGKELLQLKIWARQTALVRKEQLRNTAGQLQFILQALETQLKSAKKCVKCESARTVIDSLTKQCWELQVKYKHSQNANKEATEGQTNQVQACPLAQRGQTVSMLKKEVSELRQQNEQLHQMLFLKDNQLLSLQNNYKQNLQLLKLQMEELGQACHDNIHNLFKQKSALEAECLFLRNKLQTIGKQPSSQQLERSLKRIFLTQYIPHISSDVQTTLGKTRPRRVTQKIQQRFRTPQRNETGLQQNFSNQSAHLLSQAHLKNITDRQFAPQSSHLTCFNHIKNSLNRAPVGKHKDAGKSKQALEALSCFDSALNQLEELQRGIRKQINRSKKNNK